MYSKVNEDFSSVPPPLNYDRIQETMLDFLIVLCKFINVLITSLLFNYFENYKTYRENKMFVLFFSELFVGNIFLLDKSLVSYARDTHRNASRFCM
jgi:uncharacterized membrane protein